MRISDWSSDVCSSDLGLVPDRSPGSHGGAQHVAGRELHHAALGNQPCGLRALTRARRPQKNDVQRRPPRKRAFLMSPSYWCASRWLWIWVTVSIVTFTTISRLARKSVVSGKN